jgi:3-polyprenyl-4-hydroxybenzoate decarboxylase
VMLYARPAGVDDVLAQFAGRVLDLLGLEPPGLPRWAGLRR